MDGAVTINGVATAAGPLDGVFQTAAEVDARLASVATLLSQLESNGAANPGGSSAISSMLSTPALVRRIYRELWAALGGMQGSDWQRAGELGELLFALWDKCLAGLCYVEQSAGLLDKKRDAVPVDELKVLISDTKRQRDDAFHSWPWLSAEEEAEALDELARGEAVPVETILRELQSGAR
jgi:hypothetical protein